MKKIKDAYKELNGDLDLISDADINDKYIFFCVIDEEYTSRNDRRGHPSRFEFVCTVEEFKSYHANYTAINDDMKPLIDWSEAPENCAGYSVSSCMSNYWVLDNEMLMTAPDFGLTESKFTPRPEVKPVTPIYTQAMFDLCVPPSIGMSCEFKHGGEKTLGTVIVATKRFIIMLDDSGIERVRRVEDNNVFPLTPPIALIDGKAYQFGYSGLSRLHGIFCMKTNTLCFHSGHPSVSDCTDIKPLTLEVK